MAANSFSLLLSSVVLVLLLLFILHPTRAQQQQQQQHDVNDEIDTTTTATTTTTTTTTTTATKLQSFDLFPTAHLHAQRRGLLLMDDKDDLDIFSSSSLKNHKNNSAVYAGLGILSSKRVHHLLKDDESFQDFQKWRHLSRYERQYRMQHGLLLLEDNEESDSQQQQKHHQQQQHRRQQQQQFSLNGGLYNNYQTVPLSQGFGTHYATVWVGTPTPQRKSVIVDTGSHYTAFPCKGCKNCGEEHHTDLYFDPSKSQTFRYLSCHECAMRASCSADQQHCIFHQSYTEGSSWHAYQAMDYLFCGGTDPLLAAANPIDLEFATDFMFGCQISETGLFVTQLADGIMGMSAHEATLPKRMYEAGKLEHNLFSLCFRRELKASKKGITAGRMTLGGIDTRVDTTPMVYAKNTAPSGWYTVYVKNIFIQTNPNKNNKKKKKKKGGNYVDDDDDDDQHIMRIPLDVHAMNSGKGVIVDSGTTDSYLHKDLAPSFGQVWRQVTGQSYSNQAISLTREKLLQLPTILLQLQAYDSNYDQSSSQLGSPDDIPGLAGSTLAPLSPNDVLLAIPSTHYMEYTPENDQYTSRVYFTESRGGVLGANAMQGHNVLFDWENGRVGFAESTCDFVDQGQQHYYHHSDGNSDSSSGSSSSSSSGNVENNAILEEGGGVGGVASDCVVGEASVSLSCVESVDMRQCEGNEDTILQGREELVMTVLNAGTSAGMSCRDAVLLNSPYVGPDQPIVQCDGFGLCTEKRFCELSCQDAKEAAAAAVLDHNASPDVCRDSSGWSACDYSCIQTKIESIPLADGSCHEDKQRRIRRDCHVDACGRSDPCRVPFVVHVIFAFVGGDSSKWTRGSLDLLATALTRVMNNNNNNNNNNNINGPAPVLFSEGDVSVLTVSDWRASDEAKMLGMTDTSPEDDNVIGMKVVSEISIYNSNARFPRHRRDLQKDQSNEHSMMVDNGPSALQDVINATDQVARNMKGSYKGPMTVCEEADLYPLARVAMDVHGQFGQDGFASRLIAEIKNLDSSITAPKAIIDGPFANVQVTSNPPSIVVTSWTIRTEIPEVENGLLGSGFVQNLFFGSYRFLGVMLMVCSLGVYCGFRSSFSRHQSTTRMMGKMRDEQHRGKYSKIGTTTLQNGPAHDNDDGELEDFPQFAIRGDLELATRSR